MSSLIREPPQIGLFPAGNCVSEATEVSIGVRFPAGNATAQVNTNDARSTVWRLLQVDWIASCVSRSSVAAAKLSRAGVFVVCIDCPDLIDPERRCSAEYQVDDIPNAVAGNAIAA
jgi:hypothetical protein